MRFGCDPIPGSSWPISIAKRWRRHLACVLARKWGLTLPRQIKKRAWIEKSYAASVPRKSAGRAAYSPRLVFETSPSDSAMWGHEESTACRRKFSTACSICAIVVQPTSTCLSDFAPWTPLR